MSEWDFSFPGAGVAGRASADAAVGCCAGAEVEEGGVAVVVGVGSRGECGLGRRQDGADGFFRLDDGGDGAGAGGKVDEGTWQDGAAEGFGGGGLGLGDGRGAEGEQGETRDAGDAHGVLRGRLAGAGGGILHGFAGGQAVVVAAAVSANDWSFILGCVLVPRYTSLRDALGTNGVWV